MPIKKQFLKSKPSCKVTFRIPKKQSEQANTISLLGEFTNWQEGAIEMKKLKSGDFTHTINLETGKDYQFRYLVNEQNWINDTEADHYVPSGVSHEENGVVCV